jgi:hypothetical protein
MAARLLVAVAAVAALAQGYGGLEFGGSFRDYAPEARRLSELNRDWQGSREFSPSLPVAWFGGHGGGHAGPMTIGGRGALAYRSLAADSVEAQFGATQVALDIGWHHAPVSFLAIRPGVEIGGAGWAYYVHDRSSPLRDPGFSHWFWAWSVGVMPALELTARFARGDDRYTGLFVKAGWLFPVHGPTWYLDADPPPFDPGGFQLQVGVRFGRLPAQVLRI